MIPHKNRPCILQCTGGKEYSIFKNYKEGIYYSNLPLFYEDWTDETSKYLIACDNELHQVLDKINMDSSYLQITNLTS